VTYGTTYDRYIYIYIYIYIYQENAGHCGASLSERSICAELCVELKITR